MNFEQLIVKVIEDHSKNTEESPISYEKLGRKKSIPKTVKNRIKQATRNFIYSLSGINFLFVKINANRQRHKLHHFKYLFELLNDDMSKMKLLNIVAFRLIGDRVKLKDKYYWEKLEETENWLVRDSRHPDNAKLSRFKFAKERESINIYGTLFSIFNQFSLDQYDFKSWGETISVLEGDYVIDGGGCWGESAIYFSNKCGNTGKVFCFEFVQSNLNVLYENISLNQYAVNNIEVVENPLWCSSDISFFYKDRGDSSSISMKENAEYNMHVKTMSLDDFVVTRGLNKVDFIKLDVEGAELEILKGAIDVLKKYKPKLAIALYHKESDFFEIPNFIKGLDLGYEFYLDHYTFYHEETFLFMKVS